MNFALNIVVCLGLFLYRLLEHLVLLFVPKSYRYKSIEGEIALVTGGGSGIGRILALLLAKKGAKVVIWDLNQEGNEETCRQIRISGGQAHSYICDVSNTKSVYATAKKVQSEVGKVSILINNAGVVVGKKLLDIPDEKIEKVLAVNSLAHFWTCKAFLPDMMVANHGHIVTIASLGGLMGMQRLTDYCASKFAAIGFAESLFLELREGGFDGIKTTVVCPFAIDTGFFDGFKVDFVPMLKPEEVAESVISAMLINQPILVLPKVLNILVVLKNILPLSAMIPLGDMMNVKETMSDFRGGRPETFNSVKRK